MKKDLISFKLVFVERQKIFDKKFLSTRENWSQFKENMI